MIKHENVLNVILKSFNTITINIWKFTYARVTFCVQVSKADVNKLLELLWISMYIYWSVGIPMGMNYTHKSASLVTCWSSSVNFTHFRLLFQSHRANFKTFAIKHLWIKGIKNYSKEGSRLLKREIIKTYWKYGGII